MWRRARMWKWAALHTLLMWSSKDRVLSIVTPRLFTVLVTGTVTSATMTSSTCGSDLCLAVVPMTIAFTSNTHAQGRIQKIWPGEGANGVLPYSSTNQLEGLGVRSYLVPTGSWLNLIKHPECGPIKNSPENFTLLPRAPCPPQICHSL